MFIELIECLTYSGLLSEWCLSIPLKCFMKKVRHRERVICQSHKLIRSRTKVRHTLAGSNTSGKEALGACKRGACLGKMSMVHLLPVDLNRTDKKPLLVYSADRKSFFSQGTFFTKELG